MLIATPASWVISLLAMGQNNLSAARFISRHKNRKKKLNDYVQESLDPIIQCISYIHFYCHSQTDLVAQNCDFIKQFNVKLSVQVRQITYLLSRNVNKVQQTSEHSSIPFS
jgi:hypothetical protein